ncbi:MAG: IS1182 family transposase [Gammaproteobacteria bacterium]|nr:IS1182 family transposase [Gammaproteobacteria bacterium]
MTLKINTPREIPEETMRVARLAFPNGSQVMGLRDELGTIYAEAEFKDLFPAKGQPAESPAILALVIVLQFAEGLTDRQAADAVRGRIDWKYALGLELTDPGFDFSVLSEFRDRLIAGQAEERLLDAILKAFEARGLLKAGGRQRTDSTHVLAAIRNLNRIERVGETLRQALNELARLMPDWVKSMAPADWYQRYGHRFDSMHLPDSRKERDELLQRIGEDGQSLLERVYAPGTPVQIRNAASIEILRRVWIQQFFIKNEGESAKIQARSVRDQPPATQHIESPYDSEAHFARHNDHDWIGYKVHITETCNEGEALHVITHVKTEIAPQQDIEAIPIIQADLDRKGIAPSRHLVDAAYVGADVMVEAKQLHHIDVVGPATKIQNVSWQAREKTGFDLSQFKVDWDAKQVTCPMGQPSMRWLENGKDRTGNRVINVGFSQTVCGPCTARTLCTRHKTEGRTMQLRPRQQHEAIQYARNHQNTAEFKEEYRARAGIEGTISQGVRAFEMRSTRYIGLAKTALQEVATAAAINLHRFWDYLSDRSPVHECISSFAALAPSNV